MGGSRRLEGRIQVEVRSKGVVTKQALRFIVIWGFICFIVNRVPARHMSSCLPRSRHCYPTAIPVAEKAPRGWVTRSLVHVRRLAPLSLASPSLANHGLAGPGLGVTTLALASLSFASLGLVGLDLGRLAFARLNLTSLGLGSHGGWGGGGGRWRGGRGEWVEVVEWWEGEEWVCGCEEGKELGDVNSRCLYVR